jgi:hypothetical protein
MRKVTFHVHEEDYVRGLTVKLLEVPGEGLVPFAWTDGEGRDDRPAHYSVREDSNRVDVEVYGGTLEQFLHSRELSRRYCEVHGLEQGVYVHFPRARRPK